MNSLLSIKQIDFSPIPTWNLVSKFGDKNEQLKNVIDAISKLGFAQQNQFG